MANPLHSISCIALHRHQIYTTLPLLLTSGSVYRNSTSENTPPSFCIYLPDLLTALAVTSTSRVMSERCSRFEDEWNEDRTTASPPFVPSWAEAPRVRAIARQDSSKTASPRPDNDVSHREVSNSTRAASEMATTHPLTQPRVVAATVSIPSTQTRTCSKGKGPAAITKPVQDTASCDSPSASESSTAPTARVPTTSPVGITALSADVAGIQKEIVDARLRAGHCLDPDRTIIVGSIFGSRKVVARRRIVSTVDASQTERQITGSSQASTGSTEIVANKDVATTMTRSQRRRVYGPTSRHNAAVSKSIETVRRMRHDSANITTPSTTDASAPAREAANATLVDSATTLAARKSAQLTGFMDFLKEDFPVVRTTILSLYLTPDSPVREVGSKKKFPVQLHISRGSRAHFAKQYYPGATFIGQFRDMDRFLRVIPVNDRRLIKNICVCINSNADDGAQARLDRFSVRSYPGIIQYYHQPQGKDSPTLREVWHIREVAGWEISEKRRVEAGNQLKSRLGKWVAPQVTVLMEQDQLITWLRETGLIDDGVAKVSENVRRQS